MIVSSGSKPSKFNKLFRKVSGLEVSLFSVWVQIPTLSSFTFIVEDQAGLYFSFLSSSNWISSYSVFFPEAPDFWLATFLAESNFLDISSETCLIPCKLACFIISSALLLTLCLLWELLSNLLRELIWAACSYKLCSARSGVPTKSLILFIGTSSITCSTTANLISSGCGFKKLVICLGVSKFCFFGEFLCEELS